MIKFGNGIHSTVKCYFSYSKHYCVTMLLLGAMCSQRARGCLTYHTEPLDYIWLFRKTTFMLILLTFAEVSKHRCWMITEEQLFTLFFIKVITSTLQKVVAMWYVWIRYIKIYWPFIFMCCIPKLTLQMRRRNTNNTVFILILVHWKLTKELPKWMLSSKEKSLLGFSWMKKELLIVSSMFNDCLEHTLQHFPRKALLTHPSPHCASQPSD